MGSTRRLTDQERRQSVLVVTESPNEVIAAVKSRLGFAKAAQIRNEHDRTPSGGEGRLHRAEVDLGLARTGDAVDEERAVGPLADAHLDRPEDLGLVRVQRDGGSRLP